MRGHRQKMGPWPPCFARARARGLLERGALWLRAPPPPPNSFERQTEGSVGETDGHLIPSAPPKLVGGAKSHQ